MVTDFDFNVINPLGRSNDRTTNQRRECMQWKVGARRAGIATFDKLESKGRAKLEQFKIAAKRQNTGWASSCEEFATLAFGEAKLTPVPLSQTMIFLPSLSTMLRSVYTLKTNVQRKKRRSSKEGKKEAGSTKTS